jgi:hypothetical protein
MIPKIIHYCWFGGNVLPQLAKDCIASWQVYLPEYQIVEWNETNFDINLFPFAKEALENKKYAFVSDVCRLYALKTYGGVYMDTDVEVLRPLDIFLSKTAFSGFENDDFVPTGIMASEPEGRWVTELLHYYDNLPFIKENGDFDMKSNTIIITELMKEKGFKMNNTFQEIEEYVSFYPNDFFCPKSYKTGNTDLTENSYCIHHFAKSWISKKDKWKNTFKLKLMKYFGSDKVEKVIELINKI